MPFPTTSHQTAVSGTWKQSAPERTAAAFSLPPDGWEDEVAERLVRLREFRAGWDGHRASPIRSTVIDYVCNLLPKLVIGGVPAPFIAPLPSGGLQLEWHRNGWDVEIEISGPGQLYAYALEIATGHEWEKNLTDDLAQLRPKLVAISK